MNGKEGSATARDVLQPSLGWDVEVVVVDGGGNSPRSQSGDRHNRNRRAVQCSVLCKYAGQSTVQIECRQR